MAAIDWNKAITLNDITSITSAMSFTNGSTYSSPLHWSDNLLYLSHTNSSANHNIYVYIQPFCLVIVKNTGSVIANVYLKIDDPDVSRNTASGWTTFACGPNYSKIGLCFPSSTGNEGNIVVINDADIVNHTVSDSIGVVSSINKKS